MKKINNPQNAFTLVELAIVIVIIGLLVGGVLAGQELIKQSKQRNIISTAESYKGVLNIFKGKYNCLPGDCIRATMFFQSATNGNGNEMVEPGVESLQLWYQLGSGNANMIKGSYTGTANGAGDMVPGVNGPILMDSVTSIITGQAGWNMGWANTDGQSVNHIIFGNVDTSLHPRPYQPFLEASEVFALDTKIDDGIPGKGKVRVHSLFSQSKNSSICINNTSDANTAVYQPNVPGINCTIAFLIY